MEISLQPAYIPLLQKPKCCAVACLQMILYRNGFGLYDQEDLAVEFGVKIGVDDKDAFRESMPVMTSFNLDEGISTIESEDRINAFFQSKGVALTAEAHMYSSISSVPEMIAAHIKANGDVWVEYHSHEISAAHQNNDRIHDALIESLDTEAGTVVLIDPKPTRKQRVTVPLDMLERALSTQYGKELGLTLVSKGTS